MHQALPPDCGLAAGVAQPGEGKGRGRHADRRGQQIGQEADAGDPQGVIHQEEGKERHQADEGDEAPALSLHPPHQALQQAAVAGLDPIGGQVAGDQEGQTSADRGAGEIEEGPPKGAKEGTAGQGQDGAREEQYGGQGVDGHEQQRPRRTGGVHPGRQGLRLEVLMMTQEQGGPRRQGQDQPETGAHSHHNRHQGMSLPRLNPSWHRSSAPWPHGNPGLPPASSPPRPPGP